MTQNCAEDIVEWNWGPKSQNSPENMQTQLMPIKKLESKQEWAHHTSENLEKQKEDKPENNRKNK